MPFTLNANQCPAPVHWSGVVNPASTAAYGAKSLANGDTAALLTKLNENATRLDLHGRMGGGCYAVKTGLDISAGAGLVMNVAAGHAMIDTLVTITPATTYTVPDLSGARGYLWLSRDGVITHTTTTTPPAGAQCFIGSFVSNAGAITSVDQSGIMYLHGPIPYRRTADTSTPSDTPPQALWHLVYGATRIWLWNGASYHLLSTGTTGGFSHTTKAITGNTTLSAAEAASFSLRFTDGGGLADGAIVTFPTTGTAEGQPWYVRNDTGKRIRLLLSGGSVHVDLIDQENVLVAYTDSELCPVGPSKETLTRASTTGTTTVVNTTTETTLLGSVKGNLTIPANSLTQGKVYRLKARGQWSTIVTPGTVNFKVKLGSTQIVATGATTPAGSIAARYWDLEVLLVCQTTGASGTIMGCGSFDHLTAAAGNRQCWEMVAASAVTVDTTADQAVSLTVTWATAGPGNTISAHAWSLEALN